MRKERVLVVAPHCDDESFGCLGTLLKHKRKGDKFAFQWFSSARRTETAIAKVVVFFTADVWDFANLSDQHFDTLPLVDLIEPIERMVQFFKPTTVYIPFIGDLNYDHRLISEAAMVACRPYKKNAPKEVWMYQISGTTEFGQTVFRKDLTIPIDNNKKMDLIEKWYPNELINGRETIAAVENFQRWPTVY